MTGNRITAWILNLWARLTGLPIPVGPDPETNQPKEQTK